MKIVIFTLALVFTSQVYAQEDSPKTSINRNTVYAEAFGQGFCWSMNYDRLFNTDKRFMNSFSAGLTVVPYSIGFGNGAYYGIPVSYNWLLGKKSHHLEMGVGMTMMVEHPDYYLTSRTVNHLYLTPKLGYRYQRPQGGLFFRATVTPLVSLMSYTADPAEGGKTHRKFETFDNVLDLGYRAFPWFGLSIGYTF